MRPPATRNRWRQAAPSARRWRGCALALALGAAPSTTRAEPSAATALCVACHAAQVEHWRQGPHAAAGAALDVGAQRDPRCQRCHVSAPARIDEGVRCEGCHGDQSGHLAAPLTRRKSPIQPADRCLGCHNGSTPSVRPFDVQVGLTRVRHPREVK